MKIEAEDFVLIFFLSLLSLLAIVMTYIAIISIESNNCDYDNADKLLSKHLIINQDTFKVIGRDGKYLLLDNGTIIHYKNSYQYVKGIRK